MISDEEELARFKLRKLLFSIVGQKDNSSLPAGSPMFFYCVHCGDLTDELPEDFLTIPKRVCSECDRMIRNRPGPTAR